VLARDLIGYRGKVVRKLSRDLYYLTDNPRRRRPVIDKARKEFGFEPIVPLAEGLRRTLVWYRDNQHAPDM
jgi:UDP-glucuronate decarboxylase